MSKLKVKKIKLAKVVTCTRCEGTGEEPGAPVSIENGYGVVPLCYDCDGKKVLPRQEAIVNLAKALHDDEGTLEIDDGAKVSELSTSENNNGAYVQAWVWVPFDGHAGLDLKS